MSETRYHPEIEEVKAKDSLSTKQAFLATRRAFNELEAQGASNFDIFNALSDLFYERGEPEVSELMAEAAYKCFQKENKRG